MTKLEAQVANFWLTRYLLRRDHRAVGEYRCRFSSETIDVRMVGGKRYTFSKESWLGSEFSLLRSDGSEIVSCRKAGWLSRTWELDLSVGPARLVSKGLLRGGYDIVRPAGDKPLGEVVRRGISKTGWVACTTNNLELADLLLVGLIYHTIWSRWERSGGA